MKLEAAKIRETDLKEEKRIATLPSRGIHVFNEDKKGEFYFLETEKLVPYKRQARRQFNEEEIQNLAASIKEHGIRQPLTVIPSIEEKGKYEVISGERRLRAGKLAHLTRIPCIILDDNEKAEEISLIENIQRSDLHPIEMARAISSLHRKWGDSARLAEKISKPRSVISEALSYLKLPEDIQDILIEKELTSRSTLRKLLSFNTSEEMNAYLNNKAVDSSKPKSIFKIIYSGEGFSIEGKAYKRLSNEEKYNLKKYLQRLIDEI